MAHYIRIVNPWFLELDTNGRPAAGYKVYTLEAGSVATLVDTYSDKDLTILNTNPVILNSRGEAHIFTNVALKLVYTSPTDDLTSPIWTEDYVSEQTQTVVDKGNAVGMANNIYTVDIVPAYLSIADGFSLAMVPDASNLDSMIARVFTGTGINDCYFTGPYVGGTSSTFSIEIDATGTPDTFEWKKDATVGASGVAITGADQTLIEGITIKFSVTTGHVLGDIWTQTVRPPAYLNFCGLGDKIIYKSEGGVLTALSADDIIKDIPAHIDYSLAEDCWILLNPSLPVLDSSAISIPSRDRINVVATYSVDLDADWGNEVSCVGTFTVTLPPCTDAKGRYYYINNAGTGVITVAVDGGTDVIVAPGSSTGVTSITLDPSRWQTVQLVTNGVDWHIITATSSKHGIAIFTALGANSWVCPSGVYTAYFSGCAGGGGSGSALVAAGPGGANASAGALAGQCMMEVAKAVVPGTTYTVTIGAGGIVGANGALNNGGNGGNTTVNTPVAISLAGGTGGAHSTGLSVVGAFAIGGNGQGCPFGTPGIALIRTTTGYNNDYAGSGYGCGAQGAACLDLGAAGTNTQGNVGLQGVMIIKW